MLALGFGAALFASVPLIAGNSASPSAMNAMGPAVVACGSKESDHAQMLVAYLRRMLTGPDRARASTTFGLSVADSASIRMITDPAECERAAHAFIRERKATLPKLVYVAAIGEARWVEDPETMAGEYIAGVVFTASYDSVLALPGR
jgi:hypothetical protein